MDPDELEVGRIYWNDADIGFVRYVGSNEGNRLMPGYKDDCYVFDALWSLGNARPERVIVPCRRIALWPRGLEGLRPIDPIFLGNFYRNLNDVKEAYIAWTKDDTV